MLGLGVERRVGGNRSGDGNADQHAVTYDDADQRAVTNGTDQHAVTYDDADQHTITYDNADQHAVIYGSTCPRTCAGYAR